MGYENCKEKLIFRKEKCEAKEIVQFFLKISVELCGFDSINGDDDCFGFMVQETPDIISVSCRRRWGNGRFPLSRCQPRICMV